MCAVISGKEDKYNKLIQIGRILEKAGLANLDLVPSVIKSGERAVENSVRGCTLLELSLRYMEHLEVNDVHWFFRPVMARLIGYKGQFKKAAASSKKVAVVVKKVTAKVQEEEESDDSEEKAPKKTVLLRRSKKIK
jgi:hypothetical protein